MPSVLTREQAATPAGKSNGNGAPTVMGNRFIRAARKHREVFDDRSIALQTSATTQVGPVDVVPYGFMRHILLLVECTGSSDTANDAAGVENAPWNVFDSISLHDVNGRDLLAGLNGYDVFLINKYGGYVWDSNPVNSPAYSAISVEGNFSFLVRLPAEITEADGMGALPNMNATATYKLSYTLASANTIYSNVPDISLGTVRVRAILEAYTQPRGTDAAGIPNEALPPHLGTTQYWSKTLYNISSGEQIFRHTRTGSLIRNVIYTFYDDSSPRVRSTTEFPDPWSLEWDGVDLENRVPRLVWQNQVRERYGFAADTGVFPYDLTHDRNGHPGNEGRDLYWPTSQATRLDLRGNFGGDGVLHVLTNDIAPAAGIVPA